jgi:signal transduction histidine kinase
MRRRGVNRLSFRNRLLVIFLAAVLVPMIALSLLIRVEMTRRLTAQYEQRVTAQVSVIEDEIEQDSAAIAASLAALREAILDDNRFRSAAVAGDQSERRYLLDYAGAAMRLTGLSMLQIQDQGGRIISSGHFRNEYDRLEPELPPLLAAAPGGTALLEVRTPDKPLIALARVDSLRIGGRLFTVTGGVAVEERFLSRLAGETDLAVTLSSPGGSQLPAPALAIVRELRVPYIGADRMELDEASFRVTHDLAGLNELRRSIDRWFLIVIVIAALAAIITVGWLSSRISRPLTKLARKTSRLDLDRLDVDFETDRRDEIGALSRLLAAMTDRLRAGALRIRDAERRATLGEMARQVNHDIKNGLTPIRNVIRHLSQLSREEPEKLPEVFAEREETLESSIGYLDELASNYARLYPRLDRRPCDVSKIAESIVTDLQGTRPAELIADLCEGAIVHADPVALRRILENLVRNAVDSIGSDQGTVTVSTESVPGKDGRESIRITVTDNGAGMSEEQKTRIFDDFYTTKADGTGLGLSIVHRLVMDLDGRIDVESDEDEGTRMIIHLPTAGVEPERGE